VVSRGGLNSHKATRITQKFSAISVVAESVTTKSTMNHNFIRNREGKIIGRIDGNWLRDGTGRLVARFDESDRRTRTREGKIIGNGDQRLRALGEGKNPK